MMNGVGPSPKVIWCQSQHTDHATNPVVHDALAEKGTMTAIMLDHEEAHEKTSRWHRKQQAKPVADVERSPHQEPEEHKRQHRNHDLEDATCTARRAVAGEDLCPLV